MMTRRVEKKSPLSLEENARQVPLLLKLHKTGAFTACVYY